MSHPTDVVIIGAARTPNGKLLGPMSALDATELGAIAIRGALGQSGAGPGEVDAVVLGNVLQAGLGQCPARQAAIAAGLSWDTPANTVNRVCLSGLTAIIEAARLIRLGEARVAVAGGMESMSNAPHLLIGARQGYRYGDQTAVDSMVRDGLLDAWTHDAMGLDTEKRLVEYPVTRTEMDALSARSHQLAAKAWDDGAFQDEVVPVTIKHRKGDITVDRDEGIRPDTTIEGLARLRPAFAPDGAITAGNSSQISDGAAAVVLATRATAQAQGWPILAALRAHAQVAGPSSALAPQPANAIKAALAKAGWGVADLDLAEINEAFAAVAVYSINDLGIDPGKVNQHGGAVGIGHPLGQSGARLIVHLAHQLARRGTGKAAAALCGGTGQGDALLLEA
jgi:acetyl-CoA C-acetyltransferase